MYAPTTVGDQQTEPRWRAAARVLRGDLPGSRHGGLLDEGSLTARLVAASRGRFAVRVLAQGWQRPLPTERRALGLREGAHALVREVLLVCDGTPWVYARSVLPEGTLRAELRHLRRFGARSLGALLFADPRIRRGPFEIARIDRRHRLLPAGLGVAAPVWARRRCFSLNGRALLVQELFLPACESASL